VDILAYVDLIQVAGVSGWALPLGRRRNGPKARVDGCRRRLQRSGRGRGDEHFRDPHDLDAGERNGRIPSGADLDTDCHGDGDGDADLGTDCRRDADLGTDCHRDGDAHRYRDAHCDGDSRPDAAGRRVA
jgi:hypothetical protein